MKCIREIDTLDVDQFWETHDGHSLFRATSVAGQPSFYPVYRHGDLYSFSPFPLIVNKGTLVISDRAAAYLANPPGDIAPPAMFLDQEIERVGGPPRLNREISKCEAFTTAVAEALQADVDRIESKNPGTTNVILCGGKDSLNLLLLKWRNPTMVVSAMPNYPLVEKFVTDNGLSFEVMELRDFVDPGIQMREVAESCGMISLANWRWTAHLKEIADRLSGKAVFWKGQLADILLTDYWRSYTSNYSRAYRVGRKAYRKIARRLPAPLASLSDRAVYRDLSRSLWERGAAGQGAHMGMLRSVTGCLFLSAYHGPHTSKVMLAGDYTALSTHGDLRPRIGRTLFGRDVAYPASNPAPGSVPGRYTLRTLTSVADAYGSFGVEVTPSQPSTL